ncbi:uncharacterized protein LOC144919412 [Branchiostoma floridae x Branchiostoma belcheri]
MRNGRGTMRTDPKMPCRIVPLVFRNNDGDSYHYIVLDACLVRPKYGPPGHGKALRPPCVNYDVLLPEVTSLTEKLPESLAELGLSDVLKDLEELRSVDLIEFKGPIGPIDSGGVRRRRREATHWSRVGRVTNLVYKVAVAGGEQYFAFTSPHFDILLENDTLEAPVQSLQEDVEGFPTNYPGTTAEAMPSLVPDFHDLLNSFNCSNNGPNCNLPRGIDSVLHLDENWSIVQRYALEYEPGGVRRAISFRILVEAWLGFRIFVQLIIY